MNRRKLRERRGGLHLRFLRCLLWILGLAPRTARISFRVFRVFRGYIPGTVTGRSQRCFAESEGRRFLSDELWDAEPGARANRAEPLGCALEFRVCSCQDSGRSAGSLDHMRAFQIFGVFVLAAFVGGCQSPRYSAVTFHRALPDVVAAIQESCVRSGAYTQRPGVPVARKGDAQRRS